MNDAAFLQAIREHPEDGTHRLVYADWLDENGNPERAEFIRVQTELARLDEFDCRVPALRQREQELRPGQIEAWKAVLGDLVLGMQFDRGIPATAILTAQAFLANADRLFHLFPGRGVRLDHVYKHSRALAESPHLARLTSLDLTGETVSRAAVKRFADSPHVANLRRLVLVNTGLDWEGARWLGRSPQLDRLEVLELQGSRHLRDVGVGELAAGTGLGRLTYLGLSNTQIGAEGSQVLAASPKFARLTRLDVFSNNLGDEGVTALAASPHLARLEQMPLYQTGVGTAGVRALLDAPFLANFTSLDLGDNWMGDEAVVVLASSPAVRRLKSLHLCRNRIGPEGARALASSPHLVGLTFLDLGDNPIGEKGRRLLKERFQDRVAA
jgi:uncharacterized protein (TIGR02996 family)